MFILNIFIIYIGAFGFYRINYFLKKNNLFRLVVILSLIFVLIRMIQYHPYQGLYFNYFLTKNYKNSFDVDHTAISGEALEWVINDNKGADQLRLPLHHGSSE